MLSVMLYPLSSWFLLGLWRVGRCSTHPASLSRSPRGHALCHFLPYCHYFRASSTYTTPPCSSVLCTSLLKPTMPAVHHLRRVCHNVSLPKSERAYSMVRSLGHCVRGSPGTGLSEDVGGGKLAMPESNGR